MGDNDKGDGGVGGPALSKLFIPRTLRDVNSSWLNSLLQIVDPDFDQNSAGLSHLQGPFL